MFTTPSGWLDTERQRMIVGWVFAGLFFAVAFISSFLFGELKEGIVAPGVLIMIGASSILIIFSIYLYYVNSKVTRQ